MLSMAATKKGNKKKGGGESTASNKNRGAGGAGAKESAYANETRRIILSVQKLRKVIDLNIFLKKISSKFAQKLEKKKSKKNTHLQSMFSRFA